MMESLVPDYLAYGTERQRTGGRMEGIAPSNAYDCSDGSVVIAGNGDAIFRRYMTVIGRDDLGGRADLQSNAGRWAARDELDEAIAGWTAAAITRGGAGDARRRRNPRRTHQYGRRHLSGRPAVGAQHDPVLRRGHRRSGAGVRRVHRHRAGHRRPVETHHRDRT